jgi:hypothetical protein
LYQCPRDVFYLNRRVQRDWAASEGNERIALVDDCDPNADWGPGGCLREEGSVTRAEFRAFLFSPLVPADPAAPRMTVGHPSWRIAPGFVAREQGERLRVVPEQ